MLHSLRILAGAGISVAMSFTERLGCGVAVIKAETRFEQLPSPTSDSSWILSTVAVFA
jgi:hypothetical protein